MRPVVFACGRANLAAHRELAGQVLLLELPCVGRVSVPLLLWAVARGAGGALVLGRQQHTCRFDGAEDPGARRMERAGRLLQLAGLDRRRAQFVVPEPGPAGGARAVQRFLAELEALGELPLEAPAAADLLDHEGLDSALALLAWLASQPGLRPDGQAWLERGGLPCSPDGAAALSAGPLPQLQLLGGSLLRPLSLAPALESGLAALSRLGLQPAGVRVGRGLGGWELEAEALRSAGGGPLYSLCPRELQGLRQAGLEALDLSELLRQRGAELPRPARPASVACDGSAQQAQLIEALGHRPLDLGPDPLPDSFALTPALRAEAEQRLARAEAGGAELLLAPSPLALARWAVVCRQGSWRSSRVQPALAAQLAAPQAPGPEAVV